MSPLQDSLPIIWRSEYGGRDLEYERARVGRIFNHKRPKRCPRAIVEATQESHIVDAVQLAKQLGCRVSVRSGGHSWVAWSVRQDAILIDLGDYHHLELDPVRSEVVVSPSTTGRVLNTYLGEKGFLFAGRPLP